VSEPSAAGAPPPADDAPHVLVVDDDDRIRALLTRFLGQNGFRVSAAASAAEARSQLSALAFDLLVLDVMMPGESGLSLAGAIKAEGDLPILMLTARAESDDRVAGLETGADDYLTKPFDPRELLLRARNIIRRTRPQGPAAARQVAFGPFVFDLAREELRRGDAAIRLTERERQLLRIFAEAPDATVARDALAEFGGPIGERTVDVQINRLRRKIETDPANPLLLQTVRGVGYRLRIDGWLP